ncbi:MAG: DUF3499 family protein [Acidimicrobiia bacterium]|nr:DUF3499 family protein [Acidimicrobiia bacterium]
MKRCAKCPDPAGALMWFSYRERTAWLRDLDASFDRFVDYPLCRTHGDRFAPPSGWRLNDDRGVVPTPHPVANVA